MPQDLFSKHHGLIALFTSFLFTFFFFGEVRSTLAHLRPTGYHFAALASPILKDFVSCLRFCLDIGKILLVVSNFRQDNL